MKEKIPWEKVPSPTEDWRPEADGESDSLTTIAVHLSDGEGFLRYVEYFTLCSV